MLLISVIGFFVLVFLVATIAVAIAWMGFIKRSAEAGDRARTEEELGGVGAQDLGDELPSNLFLDERLSTLSFWDSLLARLDFVRILKRQLEQAELDWSVGRVTLAMLLAGTVAGLLLSGFVPAWAALVAALAVAYIPYAYVLHVREKRFRKFREQFPDALDSLARALRAGYPMSACIDLIAEEADEPVKTELRRVATEANLGSGWNHALEHLGRRVPLMEVNLFCAAVVQHAKTGGKLSEVIGGVAESMREALALQGEVRALSAHGKLTGLILTFLPIGIASMMMMVSPDYMMLLYTHPWGKTMILGAVGLLVTAHFVIRKMVDIKV